MHYYGPTVPDVCPTCGQCFNGSPDLCDDSYMLVLPLQEQLRDTLKKTVYILNATCCGHQGMLMAVLT